MRYAGKWLAVLAAGCLVWVATARAEEVDDLVKTGERISNMRQAFNVREGVNLVEYKMPGRIVGKPPLTAGPLAGKTVDEETLYSEYMAEMDWDPKTAKPSRKKLAELGMDDVAKTLWT